MIDADSRIDGLLPSWQRRVRDHVSCLPLRSLWTLHNVPLRIIAGRTWKALFADNIFGNAAELGFYFFFSLFPTLFSTSFILGVAARSAAHIYDKLLHYLALVVPTAALGTVIETFHETTTVATSGKLTFGLMAAVWSASVGVSAIQDTLNIVYKIQDTRSYFAARIYAIGLTVLLAILVTLILAAIILIYRCEELPYVGNQEVGLFQSREMSAFRHASFLHDVVCFSNPAKRRHSHLLRKIGISYGNLQVWRRHHCIPGEPVLPINSHGGADRASHPIERHIG